MASRRIKVSELARQLGMTSAEIVDLCSAFGVAVKGPTSSLDAPFAEIVAARAEADGSTRVLKLEGPPRDSAATTVPPTQLPPGPSAGGAAPRRRVVPRRPSATLQRSSRPDRSARLRQLIADGESRAVEFKQTARINVHTGTTDAKIEFAVLKTIAGFLNADGGTLLIGVADDGTVPGIDVDLRTLGRKQDPDGFQLWLMNLVVSGIGTVAAAKTAVDFGTVDGKTICAVEVSRGDAPSFVKTKSKEFYARVGNSTRLLDAEETWSYTKHQWPER